MNERITGSLFKQMVLHGAAAITAQKQAINDLNVFPVPDGDTGTNMSMTIGTAVAELRKTSPATLDQAVSVTASALLRGARGNSGVILSLLFRGMSKGLKGMESADAAAIAAAMERIADEPALAGRLSRGALEIRQTHGREKICGQYRDYILSVIEKRKSQ